MALDRSPVHMYPYWRDKKGDRIEVLTDYYPTLLQSNPQLQHAMQQICNANMIIDAIMEKLKEQEEDEQEE